MNNDDDFVVVVKLSVAFEVNLGRFVFSPE